MKQVIKFAIILNLLSLFFSLIITGLIAIVDNTVNLSFKLNYLKIFLVIYVIVVALFVAYGLISTRKHAKFTKHRKALLEKNGYSDEYFNYLKSELENNQTRRDELLMLIAFEYNNARQTEKAFELLNQINVNDLIVLNKAQYFNGYAYTLICVGDFEGAEKFLNEGAAYFPKVKMYIDLYLGIEHTYAVLEYAKGNLNKAENMLIRIKNKSNSDNMIIECSLFLGLIYLRTNRRAYAKDVVYTNVNRQMTPRQKEDFISLKQRVDEAYSTDLINKYNANSDRNEIFQSNADDTLTNEENR